MWYLLSMARRKRISKLETLRRARISRALKAFHRRERLRRQRISQSLKEFHRKRREAEAAKPIPGQVSLITTERPAGVFGFDVRDQRPDVAPIFVDRGGQVTASVRFGFTDPKTGEAFDMERVILFEAGEDEDEFWDNYHDALRDELDDVIGDTPGGYTKFSAAVEAFA